MAIEQIIPPSKNIEYVGECKICEAGYKANAPDLSHGMHGIHEVSFVRCTNCKVRVFMSKLKR